MQTQTFSRRRGLRRRAGDGDHRRWQFSDNLDTAGNSGGGAIGHYGGSQLTLDNISFNDNRSLGLFPGPASFVEAGTGGAIESDRMKPASFTLLRAPAHHDHLEQFLHRQRRSDVSIPRRPTWRRESAGGALDIENLAAVTINNSTFDGNLALGGNGGNGGPGMDGGPGLPLAEAGPSTSVPRSSPSATASSSAIRPSPATEVTVATAAATAAMPATATAAPSMSRPGH